MTVFRRADMTSTDAMIKVGATEEPRELSGAAAPLQFATGNRRTI